ncbi:hypothetical protein DPMN_148399 [Dreissena polymorpha]|uniref:Uncharacterized protein n=1 Tax=Dreissena polymorpha TaxID=45954 RepID=A0A9D4FE04_DREPO|nr:hypothetical protein DPMN_148399 [Dreissena polymorpha]
MVSYLSLYSICRSDFTGSIGHLTGSTRRLTGSNGRLTGRKRASYRKQWAKD